MANKPDLTKIYYKVITNDHIHRGFKYKLGLNKDIHPFNASNYYGIKGLHFSDLEDLKYWLGLYGSNKWIYEVKLLPDSCVVEYSESYRTDKLILQNPMLIEDFLVKHDLGLSVVKHNGELIKYVKDQTPKICSAAVKETGHALQYVRNQTAAICKTAVKYNGFAIQYVKNQTHDLCKLAVQQYGKTLKYIREQTPEICLLAVQQDGSALKYVQNQTDEICLAAVSQNGFILRFVKNQTPTICLAAEQQIDEFNKKLRAYNLKHRYDVIDPNDPAYLKQMAYLLN